MKKDLALNVTGWSQAAASTLYPTSVNAVVRMVQIARETRTPLYPVSTGLNFGYGGRSPIGQHATLIDLSRMDKIRNRKRISLTNPVAVIEPGVTQAHLYDFLQANCPELTFNVTGSARDTSILGNGLDRGVGYFGPRKEDLFGLEVVCGSGQLLRTGFRRLGERSPLAFSHPYGLGPILDGLFFQGNFGIVTSACFRLVPRPPCEVALSLALRDTENLPAFIDAIARMKRDGLIGSVTHIGNRTRSHATLMHGISRYLEEECGRNPATAFTEAESILKMVAPGEWASLGAVTGTAAQVRASLKEIRRRIGPIARVMVVTERRLDLGYKVMHALRFIPFARANAAAIAAIRPLHALALGVPTDAAIDNLLWKAGRNDLTASQLDQSDCGLLFINPALPMDGKFVARVVRKMKEIAARPHFAHTLFITINVETPTSLVAVINLLFNRTIPEEVNRAHDCANALLEFLHSQRLEVYRARADMMQDLVAKDPAYWGLVRSLKHELDPDNIIAPGRYNLRD